MTEYTRQQRAQAALNAISQAGAELALVLGELDQEQTKAGDPLMDVAQHGAIYAYMQLGKLTPMRLHKWAAQFGTAGMEFTAEQADRIIKECNK
jgi:hypothetical protein